MKDLSKDLHRIPFSSYIYLTILNNNIMKLLSNDHGGMYKARKQFLKDLQSDVDHLEHVKNANREYGTVSIHEDEYVDRKVFTKIVKRYLKNGR